MKIRKRMKDYVNHLEIPKAEQVLPEGCRNKPEHTDAGRAKAARLRRFAIGGAGVAAAGIIAGMLLWTKPWIQKNNSEMEHVTPTHAAPTAGVPNEASEKLDGVIGANPGGVNLWGDMTEAEGSIRDPEFSTEDTPAPGDTIPKDPVEGSTDCDILPEYPSNGVPDFTAGTLTGGEIGDLRNWDNWLRTMNEPALRPWMLIPKNRVGVYVQNEEKAPLSNVTVQLLTGEKVIYSAKTDVYGYAYLFYQYKYVGQGETPDSIAVIASDGTKTSYSMQELNSRNELEVVIPGQNKEITLDLMFVVDTTGSMGDELEFLKVELQDVIERSAEEIGAPIRTSVNFYRDNGDEYIVKYYDFRESAKEVAELVAEQYASGGGDEPEAVHTALSNAVREHRWNEDAVKLLFMILDAPPHEESEVAKELVEVIEQAAEMGIRVIPIAASGAGENTQQLLRTYAVMTGGTFLFLDNNSGYGGHHEVTIPDNAYESELLNEMMIRVIGEYCGVKIESNRVDPVIPGNPGNEPTE